jgi:hypothetical protein
LTAFDSQTSGPVAPQTSRLPSGATQIASVSAPVNVLHEGTEHRAHRTSRPTSSAVSWRWRRHAQRRHQRPRSSSCSGRDAAQPERLGTRIVFDSDRTGAFCDVFTMDPDGSDVVQLTDFQAWICRCEMAGRHGQLAWLGSWHEMTSTVACWWCWCGTAVWA